jgi:hypothetical protein
VSQKRVLFCCVECANLLCIILFFDYFILSDADVRSFELCMCVVLLQCVIVMHFSCTMALLSRTARKY